MAETLPDMEPLVAVQQKNKKVRNGDATKVSLLLLRREDKEKEEKMKLSSSSLSRKTFRHITICNDFLFNIRIVSSVYCFWIAFTDNCDFISCI